ncbi:MAG: hypothetical protein SVZ03_15895 [Spirochaetota bacterium]|nr:hypothetical protein [Spirochaetota bacterium]
MGRLSKPSKDLSSRIMTDVGFEERLIGYRLRARTGPLSISLYSFREVVDLLNDPHPRIDFNYLRKWIKDTMGDDELSNEIEVMIQKDISNHEKSLLIRNKMEERLLQCQKIL